MEEHMESVPYIPNYRPCFDTFFGHEAFYATLITLTLLEVKLT